MRELFVYYRLAGDHVEPALRELSAARSRLCSRLPSLAMRLLRRAEPDGFETWMETYAVADAPGIDSLVQQLIETEMHAMHRWTAGRRHAEVFSAWPF